MNDALFTGTFDPPTNRHLWMIANGLRLFDRIVVAVKFDVSRRTMFTTEERLLLCRQSTESIHPERIEVVGFGEEFPAAVARANGCGFMLRRMPLAHEYQAEDEFRQASHALEPCVRFVYLPPDLEYRDTTSGLVRGLVGTEGWKESVKKYVSVPVWEALLGKAG